MRVRAQKLLGTAALLMFAACSEETTEPLATPSMSVSLESNTLSVPQGQAETYDVTITRGGGFTGAVSITISGLPAGITAALNPANVLAGSTTITLTASASQSPGTYSATLRATANGVTAYTKVFEITVTT